MLYKKAVDENEILSVAEGFEDACVGVGFTCDRKPILVYDIDKAIDILMKETCSEWEEAFERFENEILKGCTGEGAPLWIETGFNEPGRPKLAHVHGRTNEVHYIWDKIRKEFIINEDNVIEVDFKNRQKITDDEFIINPQ